MDVIGLSSLIDIKRNAVLIKNSNNAFVIDTHADNDDDDNNNNNKWSK